MTTQRRYLSVEYALLHGDHELLRELGRLGGKRSGAIRSRKAESRKRLEALEAGTIKSKRSPAIKKKAVTPATEPVGDPWFDQLMHELHDALLSASARSHRMRNLAGTSNN